MWEAAMRLLMGPLILLGSAMVMQIEDVNALSAISSATTASASAAAAAATKITTIASNSGWSVVAIQAAETMTVNNRQRLQQSGALNVQRPTRIRASSPLSSLTSSSSGTSKAQRKLVHFQRHGQGYHNLFGDVVRELGMPIDMDSTDPKLNPFLRPEIRDSPLTDLGRQQCAQRRTEIMPKNHDGTNTNVHIINPQLVIVSPLLRTIQTAKITFQLYYPCAAGSASSKTDANDISWIAHEGCREELGLLVCNQRRKLSEIAMEHPEIDYQYIEHEEDVLWEQISHRRETVLEKTNRIYDFMKFLETRKEDEIVVVGHSSWLFYMLNAVVECDDDDDDDLARWFLTSEVRSMYISFSDNPEYAAIKAS